MSRVFLMLLRRDLTLAMRRRAEMANPLLFFVMVTALFPLGVSPSPNLMLAMAPGVIWVAALLAALLSLDGIFRSDFEDGSLEQFLLSAQPVWLLVLAKVFAHWLLTGLPLLLVAPLIAVLFNLPADTIWVLLLTLALGTPVLSLVGAIGVALTVGLRRGGVILSLLVLPLYVPVLIFGSNAVEVSVSGLPVAAQVSIMSALLALALSLAPPAAATSLRISLS